MFFAFGLVMALCFGDERIVLDSAFEDWSGLSPIVRDARDDAGDAGLDIGDIWITSDREALYLAFEVQETVNLQVLPGSLELVLDVDANPETGLAREAIAGADLVVIFTPKNPDRPDAPGMGAALEVATQSGFERRSPYEVGLAQSPTYASDRFEVRLQRKPSEGVPALGERVRARMAFYDGEGERRDVTEIFDYELKQAGPRVVTAQAKDPLARRDGARLRLMNWNVLWGKVFEDPEPFARVLRAVDPDVITFQELTGDDIEGRLRAWLEKTAPAGAESSWTVNVGDVGGGTLFSAVATRRPAEVAELRIPARRDRDVMQSLPALVVKSGDRRTLVISIHLPCCGGIGSPQDEARLQTVADLDQALKDWMSENRVTGIILAGDYNLVGSKQPLTTIVESTERLLGRGRSIELLRLEGSTTATWRDPKQPFVPGQLDWVVTGGKVDVQGGFVLDTREVETRWRSLHGLEEGDTDASDHLPLVVDFE
ncbi:MAG: endonuclease/exonuclease/phosphatase family protein [Planctomycetota bacterium]